MRVVGVDGTKGGWIAIALEDGRFAEDYLVRPVETNFSELDITDLASRDSRVYEVHPEVSFRAMNDGRALRYRKKSWGGAHERIDLLHRHGIDLARLGTTASAPLDDVVDAAAAAWSADRISSGAASSLPDPPESIDGHDVAIWY